MKLMYFKLFRHFSELAAVLKFLVTSLLIVSLIFTIRFYESPQIPKNECNKENLLSTKILPSNNTNSKYSMRQERKHVSEDMQMSFENLNLKIGRWDSKRLYKMYDFALVGDSYPNASYASLVCLATQSSVERLYSLVQVSREWRGPISLAIYVAGSEEYAILQYYVSYLRECYDFIRSNVTIHIAVPKNREPTEKIRKNLSDMVDGLDCKYPQDMLFLLLKLRTAETTRWRIKNEYPQNHLRNLARKGCQTKYVFLTDIDIIPSKNIVPMLNIFLLNVKCIGKCAFVIPTFEIDIRANFPSTKAELLRLHKKGLARPFHEKVFVYNQYATNFSRWINTIQSGNNIEISHSVTNYEFLYEPFYLAIDDTPPHDERFIGYGFTRNTQVYEMHIAGYSFYVLSPVFTCHWGLQHKKSRPSWREHQNNVNRKRFNQFKNEIFARYKNNSMVLPHKSKNWKNTSGFKLS